MTSSPNPYDAPVELHDVALPVRTKVFAGMVGVLVVAGAVITLGTFLFAVLILVAGQTQPTPLPKTAWLDSPLQKLILGFGSIIVLLISVALGSWVIYRIVRSQRLTEEVLFRRRELMAAVGEMQFAMQEKKDKDALRLQGVSGFASDQISSGE